MSNKSRLGGFIKAKRKELGITQAQLAEMSGLSLPTISHIENGVLARRSTLQKLSQTFDIDYIAIVELNQPESDEDWKELGTFDFVNVETTDLKVIVTLNWERLIVNKTDLKKIEFKFEDGYATQICVHIKEVILEVPVKVKIEEALLVQFKSKKLIP